MKKPKIKPECTENPKLRLRTGLQVIVSSNFKNKLHFNLFVCGYLHAHANPHEWRLVDNLREFVFYFQLCIRDPTKTINLGGRYLSPLWHLHGPLQAFLKLTFSYYHLKYSYLCTWFYVFVRCLFFPGSIIWWRSNLVATLYFSAIETVLFLVMSFSGERDYGIFLKEKTCA